MSPLIRRILAVVAGLIVAAVVVAGVEAASSVLYPLPEGIDHTDREAMTAAIAQLPTTAFLAVLVAWGLGALAGAWTAVRISGVAVTGYIIGALLLAAGVANLLAIPHPVWMWPGALVAVGAGTLAGVRSGPAIASTFRG